MKKRLSVADFFCGAGGFSEGFRQAGFEIVFGLDNWKPAIETFKLNHPNSNILQTDILLLNPLKDIEYNVPDTDIIIGSPPCVSFSSSNHAGKADKSKGLCLVEKFLQIIAIKKHKINSKLKYWLMENVPKSRFHLKSTYRFKDLGLKKNELRVLNIKKSPEDIALNLNLSDKGIHKAVDYDVPQRRERFICGEFPEPQKIDFEKKTQISLGKVILDLRSPNKSILDPNYDFKIDRKNLTDNYYNTLIPKFEWEEAKIKKQQARYYGRMSFPESLDMPSRTIMATRSTLSREAMILPNGAPDNYKFPTIREVASLMSFPITYLFQAGNECAKYRLVGNAVCPKMAFAFAKEICKTEGVPIIYNPVSLGNPKELIVDLNKNPPPKKIPRDKHPLANFAEIVPDLKSRNFRVELDNNSPKITKKIVWTGSIHHATGKDNMKYDKPKLSVIKEMLLHFEDKRRVMKFIKYIESTFNNKIPNAIMFQNQHTKVNKYNNYLSPRESLAIIKEIVDTYFPEDKFKDICISNIRQNNSLFIGFDGKEIPKGEIPLRILSALYSVSYLSNITNLKNH